MQLLLTRRVVADDGVDVAIDQAGAHGDAIGINDSLRVFGVDIFFFSDLADDSVDAHDAVGIEDRLFELSGDEGSDIADYEFIIAIIALRMLVSGHLLRGSIILRCRRVDVGGENERE